MIGVKNEGILFLYNMEGKLKTTFVKLRFSKIIYANADMDPDDHSKSVNVIQNFGFFEYILCITGKATMVAIDPDSHFFLDEKDPEDEENYIPKQVPFSNGLGETPKRII